ncbi:unnamed protein product, partial [Allacma fusca]
MYSHTRLPHILKTFTSAHHAVALESSLRNVVERKISTRSISIQFRSNCQFAPDFATGTCSFCLRVTSSSGSSTIGWIGFGFTKDGKMDKADIQVGGITSGGLPYYFDRTGISHTV